MTTKPPFGFVRHHHFCVTIAKQAFLREDGRLAFAFRPLRLSQAAALGLQPLMLYSLSTAGASLYWLILARCDCPPSLGGMLSQAWAQAPGLRGVPDALLVNRHVANAAPDLAPLLKQVGVELIQVGDSKPHAAALRTAQGLVEQAATLSFRLDKTDRVDLATFPTAMALYHDSLMRYSHGNSARTIANHAKWLELAPRPAPTISAEIGLQPGPWLTSWEAALPPQTDVYRIEHGGVTYIREGSDPNDEDVEEEDLALADDAQYKNEVAQAAKKLLTCWPNPLTEVAQTIGTTAKQLNWFVRGRSTVEFPVARLAGLLTIEPDESLYYEPRGAYVIVAPSNGKAASDLYTTLSHGGDLSYSFEALPDSGNADPSWRYVLFASYASEFKPCVLMVPRGSKLAEDFPGQLINCTGARHIEASLYRDLVATCARACLTTPSNTREILAFAKRNWKALKQFFDAC